METTTINYIITGIIGGGFGCGVAFAILRFKKIIDKKRRLSDIQKQSQVDFMIPEIINGEPIQKKVNIHEYIGIDKNQKLKEDTDLFNDLDGLETVDPDEEYNNYANFKKDN